VRNSIVIAVSIFTVLILSGCTISSPSAPNTKNQKLVKQKVEKTEARTIGIPMHDPYEFRMKPIIGSRNLDARTSVDMGVVLKIWVAPYKSRSGFLTSSHDLYIWGRRPDFITGEELPQGIRKNRGLLYRGKIPFVLTDSEIDRSNIQNDKNIQNFIEKLPIRETLMQKIEKPSQSTVDKKILEFIKKNKDKEKKK